MKKVFFVVLVVSVSLVFANQFIAPRVGTQEKKGLKELQQDCCELCLDIQNIAVSGYMRLLAELNDLLLNLAADCITGDKQSLLLASKKQDIAVIAQQLRELKQKMIENNKYIASFIEQFSQNKPARK